MIVVLAIVFFLAIYLAILFLVISIRPMPLSGALALAFACLISFETMVLNGLSLFHCVNRAGLVISHLVFLVFWLSWAIIFRRNVLVRYGMRIIVATKNVASNPVVWLVLSLFGILILTAFVYPPNAYDSMTYHMARVAHWIQQESVDYYPTNISRQNVMGPGAEYLILFFQLLTGTDYLANGVQLFSFGVLIIVLIYVLRVFRVPQRLSPFIVALCISAPMAVMQATSTQNDLVNSLMTIAILVACIRLMAGQMNRLRTGDFILIGSCLSAGFLVKPISLIIVAPFLGLSLLLQLKPLTGSRKLIWKNIGGFAVVCLVITIIAGPDIMRKISHHVSRHEVYPLFSQWDKERILNPVSILGQNTPFPNETKALFKRFGYRGKLLTNAVFFTHEDFIGNPVQVLSMLILTLLTISFSPFVIKRPKQYGPLLILSLAPALSWCIFGFIVKNQLWITRLQLPLIFLLPFSFLYVVRIAGLSRLSMGFLKLFVFVMSIFSLAYGTYAATHNRSRPLDLQTFWGEFPSRVEGFYKSADYDFFLEVADKLQCRRIGLLMGGDSMDYPLTWRAMKEGRATRHVFRGGVDDWPCMIYVAKGGLECLPKRGKQWLPAGGYHTYYRNLEYEFQRSLQSFLLLNAPESLLRIEPLHDVRIEKQSNQVVLHSFGGDPIVLLPELTCRNAQSMVLRLEIKSPEKTEAQIFYRTRNQGQFTEALSFRKEIGKGENIVYFQLPADEIVGQVRLDPGKVPGDYIIRSLEFRAIVDDRKFPGNIAENQ